LVKRQDNVLKHLHPSDEGSISKAAGRRFTFFVKDLALFAMPVGRKNANPVALGGHEQVPPGRFENSPPF
jgi:hypothetical protein